MIRTTYIVVGDTGPTMTPEPYIMETRVGSTFGDVVDDIIGGQFDHSFILRVYKLDGERIEDVSADVCAEILKYANAGKSIDPSTEQFLDFHGFNVPGREAA